MIMFLYRGLYYFIRICLFLLSPLLSDSTKKWIELRSSMEYQKKTILNPIWFHASSGEIEYVKPIIRNLKKENPHQKIIVSYSSSSAEKLFSNIQSEVDLFFPLPWDSPTDLKKVFLHFSPLAVIFSRTDFWPELIHQSQISQTPLFAVSLFPQMTKINFLLYKWLLNKFNFITTVDENSAQFLKQCTTGKVFVLPDTRFDQVFERLNSTSRINFTEKPQIVLASTWPEDEAVLFPSLPDLMKQGLKIILCPHQPERCKEIETIFKPLKTKKLSDYSKNQDGSYLISNDFDILIIDQVGYLADIYRSTQIAFVGGSFKQKVHSVMEPLCAGNSVIVGPYFSNNPEALVALKNNFVYTIQTTEEFKKNVAELLGTEKNNGQPLEQKNRLQNWTESQKGSSVIISNMILKEIKDSHEIR